MSIAGRKARLKKYQERIRRGVPLPGGISKEDVEAMDKELLDKPKKKIFSHKTVIA